MNIAQFTQYLFDRPVDTTEWYFSDEHEDPEIAKDLLAQLTTKVFNEIAETSRRFSEKQICMGLRYLINPSCGPIPYLYLDTSIDFSVRANAITSMRAVFRGLFAHLSDEHGPYRDGGGLPLSYRETCYMWWDVLPRHGSPRRQDMEDVDTVIYQTIVSILGIDNLACQESALHGLGHWFASRPDEVVEAVRSFLPVAPNELKQYAAEAMRGHVQ